jgi:hypothetical protein
VKAGEAVRLDAGHIQPAREMVNREDEGEVRYQSGLTGAVMVKEA